MDTFDIKMLEALQDDGRLTNFELGERVGLSPSQCSRRRAALEASGTIASYHAHLSPEALGLGVLVFVQVKLAARASGSAKRFQKLIDGTPEVQEAFALTGEADYLVKLIVPDLQALARIISDVFLPNESVEHVRSSIVLECLKQSARLPLKYVEEEAGRSVRESSAPEKPARPPPGATSPRRKAR